MANRLLVLAMFPLRWSQRISKGHDLKGTLHFFVVSRCVEGSGLRGDLVVPAEELEVGIVLPLADQAGTGAEVVFTMANRVNKPLSDRELEAVRWSSSYAENRMLPGLASK